MPPRRLKTIAYLMDESIRLPGGFRIGLDGIIGLIPGIGDLAGLAVSGYIMAEAVRAGASKSVLLRMAMNSGVDAIVGAIPIFGDLFDFAFKANRRNLGLLEAHLGEPRRTRRVSRAWLALITATVVLVIAAVVVLLARLAGWIWNTLG